MNLLLLGDGYARNLGLNIKRARLLVISRSGCWWPLSPPTASHYVYRVGSASFMPRHFHVRPSHIDARYLAGRRSLGVGV